MANVMDAYWNWTEDLIREDVQRNSLPFGILMLVQNDFNFAGIVRSANALGAREIFYHGPSKRFDRRGTVGAYIYSQVTYLPTLEDVFQLKNKYEALVAAEINVPKAQSLENFHWPERPLIILGEERQGLSPAFLEKMDYVVSITQRGSVRSLNAACAASILMHNYIQKRHN